MTEFLATSSGNDLARENAKLRKIVKALMDRVERGTNDQGGAFGLFQTAITLDVTVRQRTAELQAVNQHLLDEMAEREAAEHALYDAKLAAERANLSKTKFLAAASHDLLQPLHVARLFLGELRDRAGEDSSRTVERIETALESAEHLISTLLEISRLDGAAQSVDLVDVRLDDVLERLRDEYAPQAEEANLRFRCVSNDAVVRTDRRLLERLLRNFLSNALKYTERGGIVLGCRRRGDVLRIEVWDTGVGIPAERLGEVFEEFRRLDVPGRTSGLGLGLAIVERIAKLLDARIDARSTVGRGSTFAVEVSLAREAAEPAPAPPALEPALPVCGTRRVLVIDDDAAALDGLLLVLRNWGCEPVGLATYHETLAFARDAVAAPGFIIADFHIGEDATGLDAITELRRSFDLEIPAVVLTADVGERPRSAARSAGCWYLNKPAKLDRLRALIEAATREREVLATS
ncbi:MAG: hybrid sensor histidine kinase/response regulator [Vulcanimicrobiaceae bacterium]